MPWSSEFAAMLRSERTQPVLILQNLEVTGVDTGWSLSSYVAGSSSSTDGVVQLDGLSSSSAELQLRTWSSTVGTFSVTVTGPMHALLPQIRRGQWVRMRIGFVGWDWSRFQTVAIGSVWNVRGHSLQWTIECRDVLASLSQRLTTTAGEQALFTTVSATTTTTVNYTAGAATVTVSSTTGFQRQNDGGGALKGAIRLTYSGTTFILTYTGTTATTFTGVSASGVLGTTASSLGGAATVSEVGYLDDHPIDAVRRWLTIAGDYSWLPSLWAVGFPDVAIDHGDCDRFRAWSQPASGADDWEWGWEAEQTDALTWIAAQVSPGGFFLTLRQGMLTIRCVRDPDTAPLETTLDDADIIDVEEWEAYDSSLQVAYESHTVTSSTASTTVTEDVSSFPCEPEYESTVAVYSNQSAIRAEVSGRLAYWYTRVPERLRLRTVIRCAQLAPGDVIEVSTMRVYSRDQGQERGMVRRRALVTGVAPDWGAWTCAITLAILPASA